MTLNNNSPTDNLIREKWVGEASAVSELCRKFNKKDLAEWGLVIEAKLKVSISALREKDAEIARLNRTLTTAMELAADDLRREATGGRDADQQ